MLAAWRRASTRRSEKRRRRAGKQRRREIDEVCIGYSGRVQWDFFHDVAARPEIRNVCVLGVYFGRDIGYLAQAFVEAGRDDYRIDGVDLFADVPGADWPEDTAGKSWEDAGFGPAPQREAAEGNLRRLGLEAHVELHRADAITFLEGSERVYDFVYIDVAHDYETTRAAIEAASQCCSPHGIIAGDDYSDEGTWGVMSAVTEAFPRHEVHGDWVWSARVADRTAKVGD